MIDAERVAAALEFEHLGDALVVLLALERRVGNRLRNRVVLLRRDVDDQPQMSAEDAIRAAHDKTAEAVSSASG